LLIQYTQEKEVVLQETMEEHTLTDQTSVKMNSYENEGFVLDVNSPSDNIAEAR